MMRKYIYLLLLLPLIITISCRDDGKAMSILYVADSLMEEYPDSSLNILKRDSLLFERSGKAVRMAYTLSKTEAEDKCYIPHHSDSAMLPVAEYFTMQGTPLQHVRSQYVLGRVYCDLRLYGHALSAFDNALNVKPDNDSAVCRYKARAAIWAGAVYEEKGLHKDALRYNKLSYSYAKNVDVQSIKVYSLRDIGRSYSYLKKNNVAIPYYMRAAEKAKAMNDAYLYNMVMEELAGIYIEKRLFDNAKQALSTPFKAVSDADSAAHYFVWSLYYENIDRLDSAIFYNKKGMKYGSVSSNKQASLDLARLYEKAGNQAEALKYYGLYSDLSDSVAKERVVEYADFMSGMEYMLDVERKNAALASSRMHLTVLLSVLVISIIIALFIVVRIYLKHKRKVVEQQERVRRYRQQQRLRELQSAQQNKERIKMLEKELLDSNKTLSELRKELIRNEAEILKNRNEQLAFEHKHGELLAADFADTDVYKLYHNPMAVPTSADYHRLAEALNKAYNNFTLRLKEFYPDITGQETWLCCMVKADLKSKAICNISSYSASSLSMAKARLYAKMFHTKGSAKAFDTFVRNF